MRTFSEDTKIQLSLITPELLDPFITRNSPRNVRTAVHRIAQYFKREEGYDFTQFSIDDTTDYSVYLFYYRKYNYRRQENSSEIFGAASFRRRAYENVSERWCLQWIWIHPYLRNKGLLKEAWPVFQEKYGNDFLPETPYSKAMVAFLRNHASKEQRELFKELGWSDVFPD